MSEVAVHSPVAELDKAVSREAIIGFENELIKTEGVFFGDYYPLKHTFSDGIYVREISIPAGVYLTGKIHKHEHPNFLLSGVVDVVTESGRETLIAPMSMISKAGTKRALHTITPCVWITVHVNPTNTQDIVELEKMIIAGSYDEYDAFKAIQGSGKAIQAGGKATLFNRVIKFLKGGTK